MISRDGRIVSSTLTTRTMKRQRQHVIPQFYLRGFAHENKLIRFTIPPNTPEHSISVRDATVRKGLYSPEYESHSGNIEGLAAPVLKKFLQGNYDIDDEITLALCFLVPTLAKNERLLDIRQNVEQTISELRGLPILQSGNGDWWATTLLKKSGEMLSMLLQRRWLHWKFHKPRLICSDTLVGLVPRATGTEMVLRGFSNAAEIYVPLGARDLLILSSHEQADRTTRTDSTRWTVPKEVEPHLASHVNNIMLMDARHQVFCHPSVRYQVRQEVAWYEGPASSTEEAVAGILQRQGKWLNGDEGKWLDEYIAEQARLQRQRD